jgi:transcriptional regulator with XRE-family HTH domain
MSEKRLKQLQKEVAKRVQSILDGKEWSMSFFADQLGKSKSHVHGILHGKGNLTLRTLADMEEILGEKILNIEPEKPKKNN